MVRHRGEIHEPHRPGRGVCRCGDLDREPGLADSSRSGERHKSGSHQRAPQCGTFLLTTNQRIHWKRRCCGGTVGCRYERGILRQHGCQHRAQLGSGLNPDLVDEVTASLRVRLERFHLPAIGVQRLDQQHSQPLPQRVFLDQRTKFSNHRRRQARVEILGQAKLQHREPFLLQPDCDGPRPGLLGPLGQGRSVPSCQGLAVAACPRQILEAVRVDRAPRDVEPVTPGDCHDSEGAKPPTQITHIALDQVGSRPRRLITPQGVHDPVHAHVLTTVYQQHREHTAHFRCRQRDLGAVAVEHS
jgi:hypothetical protein